MRRLILSDIHSNLEALETVLRHAEGGYDQVVCCGDVAGYNASPVEVAAWAREHAGVIVRGNHDRACGGIEDLEWFNPAARIAAIWSMNELGEDAQEWLRALPAGPLSFDTFQLCHGSPGGEDDYLADGHDVEPLKDLLTRRICFAGHTHIQTGWSWQRGGLQRLPRPAPSQEERVIDLDPDYLYLVNPGSVGQPRDGDPRAAYAIWDDAGHLLYFRRARYNVRAAQMRIMDAGLPPSLADRLALGR
ncbi:MAG: metallophosphoesterase family protein [Candidatus Solibacter usitatus]|nr:metallophosphoesterase family protein [Candidatus Solibacter usitatus]